MSNSQTACDLRIAASCPSASSRLIVSPCLSWSLARFRFSDVAMFLVLCYVSEFQGIDLESAGTDAKVFDGDVLIAAATVETCWVQQFVDIKENDQLPGQSGEAGNAVTAFGQHGVRRGLNALLRDSQHLRYPVHRATHRALSDVDDDRSSFAIRCPGFEPQQTPKIKDRNDRSPQIAHALDVVGHLGNSGDLVQDDDLLNLFDGKGVILFRELKPDELPRIVSLDHGRRRRGGRGWRHRESDPKGGQTSS